jgi:hypothetical protein
MLTHLTDFKALIYTLKRIQRNQAPLDQRSLKNVQRLVH